MQHSKWSILPFNVQIDRMVCKQIHKFTAKKNIHIRRGKRMTWLDIKKSNNYRHWKSSPYIYCNTGTLLVYRLNLNA